MFQDDASMVHVGNLHPLVTENPEILYELFSQVGPVIKVIIPEAKHIDEKSSISTTRLLATIEPTTNDSSLSSSSSKTENDSTKQTNISMQTLRGLFEPFGTVMSFACSTNEQATVVFSNSKSCHTAAAKLNGMVLGTLTLTTKLHPVIERPSYGFVVFDGPENVLYAMRVLTGISLFGQQITIERKTIKPSEDDAAELKSRSRDRSMERSRSRSRSRERKTSRSRSRSPNGIHTVEKVTETSSPLPEAWMINGTAPPSTDAGVITRQCILTNISKSLMYVDVRDLAEWAARCQVEKLQFEKNRIGSTTRSCTLTFETIDGTKRAVELLDGKSVQNMTLQCQFVQRFN
jgi:RNA recognition motif-containing protein